MVLSRDLIRALRLLIVLSRCGRFRVSLGRAVMNDFEWYTDSANLIPFDDQLLFDGSLTLHHYLFHQVPFLRGL